MAKDNILTFEQLGQRLADRAKSASASTTTPPAATPAAPATPVKTASDVPAVPEKDPQEKGTVSVPVDPAANPAKQNVPASASNTSVTPPLPAPAPAKTVSGEETPGLTDKIAKVSAGIAGAITALRSGKSASEAAPVNVTPATPPNDKKNTDGGAGKEAKPADAAKDPAAAPAPAPAADPAGAMPKTEPTNTDSKKASGEVQIDPALYAKFAAELATSEEGQAVMRKIAEAKFGAGVVDDLIKAAMFMAEQEALIEEAEASGAFAAEQAFKQASAEDQQAIIKLAHIHQAGVAACADELEQHFYLEGAKAAAAMMEDPAMMGEQMPADYNAEGVSDTDIVAVLDQLVQAGKITPEEAAQALAILQGGGEGGEGGAGGPPPEGGEAPSDDAPPEEKEAHAILKQANAIAAGEVPAEPAKQ